MLTADKVRYECGVQINEKIIPDDAVSNATIASWVKKGGKMKPGGKMVPIGVTLHNTADLKNVYEDSEQYTRATWPNCKMKGVVVHYYVDDVSAWQNLREDEPGWHASDSNGDGNKRTIAVECIMDGTGSPEDVGARDNAARLIASILKRHNWTVENNLYTHNHWMKLPDSIVKGVSKNCPKYILPTYDSFKALVNKYLKELKQASAPVVEEDKDIVEAVEDVEPIKLSEISVGDILEFNGSAQYTSANSTVARKVSPSEVKVTRIVSGDRAHPVHVRSVDETGKYVSGGVYGWVNVEDLSVGNTKVPYLVKVTSSSLNRRSGPGTGYSILGTITNKGVYTIVEVKSGWGKLKTANKGWIKLSYTKEL